MDSVNLARLARYYEDVDWVERSRRACRGDKKRDEYQPAKRPDEEAADTEHSADTFEPAEPQE